MTDEGNITDAVLAVRVSALADAVEDRFGGIRVEFPELGGSLSVKEVCDLFVKRLAAPSTGLAPDDAEARALVAEYRSIWPGRGFPAITEAKRLLEAASRVRPAGEPVAWTVAAPSDPDTPITLTQTDVVKTLKEFLAGGYDPASEAALVVAIKLALYASPVKEGE